MNYDSSPSNDDDYEDCCECGSMFHFEELDRDTGRCEQCTNEWYEENDKC